MEQYKDKDWLHGMYWGKENSTLSIAKIFNIHPELIRRQLIKFNIRVRNYDESKATEKYKKRRRELSRGENNYFWGKSFLGELNPCWGKKLTENHRDKIRNSLLGFKHTEETRKKMSYMRRGEDNPNWKDGSSLYNHFLRGLYEQKEWRKAVFKRDNYTCVRCSARSGNGNAVYLHAHHILGFANFPEERLEIDNGATLCKECHKYIHSIESR